MAPVVTYFPKEDISHAYKKLAGSIIGEKYKKSTTKKTKKKTKGKKKNVKS